MITTPRYLLISLGVISVLGAIQWQSQRDQLDDARRPGVIPESTATGGSGAPTAATALPPPGARASAHAQPAPTVSPPPAQPAVVEEPATCQQTSGPYEIARNAELDIGTFLRTDGATVGMGWVVPARRSPGPDDVSVALLNPDGSFREWVLEGVQSRQRDDQRPSVSVMRVLPLFANGGGGTPRVDRRYLNPSGQWVIECGDIGNVFASPIQVDPALPAVLAPDWNAMYWCRSAETPDPFVLAARTAIDGSGALTGEARLFATRTAGAPLPSRFWTLRFAQDAVTSARDPSAKLRELAGPNKLSVAQTPHGYAVSFIHRSRLYLGWLDSALNPVGDLTALGTAGATPGRATMKWNGSEVLMVFADRAASSDLYSLRAARIPFGRAPDASQFFTLPTSTDRTQHEFAPDLTRLDDGSMLLTWTYGAERGREGYQQVCARRYDASLNPRGGPLLLGGPASDSEVIAVNGNRAVLVMLSGTAGMRTINTVGLTCQP